MDEQHLIDHLQRHSAPMEPLPTKESPQLGLCAGIRAVVFDIYGTLFISGSGDISLAKSEDRSGSLVEALGSAGFNIIQPSAAWSNSLMETLECFREKRQAQDIPFPEVRIEEVWSAFIEEARKKGWLSGHGSTELAIVDHECRVNPCWPMPGLDDLLTRVSGLKLPMGIVSNAQFYTPLLFPALLGNSRSAYSFKTELEVWSYREREGKPSLNLYQILKDQLRDQAIQAGEVLYVGNDLRNDIWPAARLGFRTVLFAGDRRSLRWREDDPDCAGVQPDFLITALPQLLAILG